MSEQEPQYGPRERRRRPEPEKTEHECVCDCGHDHREHEHCGGHGGCGHGHRCTCQCHGEVKIRVSVSCECGKGPPRQPTCPPPDAPAPPGTVDLPQPPLYHPPTLPVPPWGQGKPPVGSPGELPWFQGKIGDVQRNGPTFGPRKDEFLPYLLVRANATDRGARPLTGVFWESPDIYVIANQSADGAPLRPPSQGGVAQASAPNTLYAQVWNLGKAPAFRVRVEFWWFDPSLGFSRGAGHLVGAAYVDLEDRFTRYPEWREVTSAAGSWLSRGAHAIVKCPQTWVPVYLNDGHECLVVRVGDAMMDPVPTTQFSPAMDRHIGQRNIAVVRAASPVQVTLNLDLGWHDRPGAAEVEVVTESPGTMEWLQLYAGSRNPGFRTPAQPVIAGLLPPMPAGMEFPDIGTLPADCRQPLLRPRERFRRGCDPLRIPFHAALADVGDQEAQVLRVRQRIEGVLVGGYTVVLTS